VNPYYVYVVVRKDLSYAQIVVQACHAAMESTRYYPPAEDVIPNLVLIAANDESHLAKCALKLDRAGIRYRKFIEPDFGDEFTALATEPIIDPEKRKVFKPYTLLKGGKYEEF